MRPGPLHLLLIAPLLALPACETGKPTEDKRPAVADAQVTNAATSVAPTQIARVPKPTARSAAEMNTTTAEQRAEAAKPATTAERKLGSSVASLGDPTQPGFWVKTPLVTQRGNGRIVNPANGKSAKVELLPLGGAASSGSQVSLPALQLIGVSLTDLPQIDIYSN